MIQTRQFVPIVLLACAAAGLLARASTQTITTQTFPTSWIGAWKGPASLVTPGRDDHEFRMELIVAATDDPTRYAWTIVYAETNGQRQERKYELIVRDAANEQYAVDEKNGIIIPSTLLDGTLYSSFEVQGTRVNTRMKLESPGTDEQRITVEMISGSVQSTESSGGKDGVPEVLSVIPRSLQRATLTRDIEPATTP